MSKFKVGDRVRRIRCDNGDDMRVGRTGTIKRVQADGDVIVDVDGGSDACFCMADYLELVPVAEATGTDAPKGEPKFKVGDRVSVHDHPYYLMEDEDTGTIIGASDGRGDWDVDLDNYDDILSFFASEMVAVAEQPQPLRIQPGKFYTTRDGRKVGPMRRWSDEAGHRWEADDDELSYIWADDGTEIDSDIDDGADLVAEASSSDNGGANHGSTAGFTVPLCAYDDDPGWYAAELGRAYADGYAAGLQAGSEEVSDKASAAHRFRDDVDRVVLDCLKRFKRRGLLAA